ncbi:PREDICTED: putative disease resistance protein RGA3 [Prunus mume]|uniref:Disease resistance protein RGA3 n=1 Tax=Prunus mume TaxID=102107 RepID=A0ABM1LXM5_PRUMU|nr:PREDICTED: putative disease resistance protein RGA3 [Prunus mume]XP_016652152.1 PREDICTED: putative disease resistance protein RGA3 [Prunus mume]
MAEALISVLLEQLASIIQQEVRLVMGVRKEVAKLTSNFKDIEVVLENAEERQVKEVDVRQWLERLKDVSYEMDDVLDKWSTEILKQHIQKQEAGNAGSTSTTKKVCFCIPTPWFCFGRQVVLRHDIAVKIKELNERLALIASERQKYDFQSTKRRIEQIERQKSSSFIDKTFGRVDEKDRVVEKLVSGNGQGGATCLVIPIIGMGGIGKTTLAQLAYNDEKVQAHFNTRIWVCVSDPFDEIKIAKAIIEGLTKETPASNELQTLKSIIHESVKGKKFLLVLDDVWNQDYGKWEQLKLPLQNGAVGSRILVTTRKEEVARMVGAHHIVNLEVLSEENCWALFYHIALADREKNESKVLEFIGKEIVKKCKGLPLLAKTMGGLMRYKKTKKEWEDVLNSKIWKLDVVEEQVFQPLLLSYYDLAPAIKRCLLYCVIFPKDYEIAKDELIELWISQNYLNSIENKEKEAVGEMYFDNLVMRSFFQEFQKDDLGNIMGCKMHDVVHDFLQFLTKNECLVLEAEGGNNKRIMEFDGYNKVRHLTLMFAPEGPLIPSSLCNCKNLRTLATFDSKIASFGRELISQVKCLRTLNLRRNSLKEVPNEVGELAHLRYLDLSSNHDLMKLPDTMCNLINLQTLRLMSCWALERLPEGMGKLINLQHLHVRWCRRLKLPKGIARLTSLRTLDEVCIHDDDDVDNNKEALFELSDLRNMDQLRGSFRIWFKKDLKDARQAEKAHLVNKNCLVSLEFKFPLADETAQHIAEETLNALQPPPNLESLSISGYRGTTLRPHWMTSLNKLRSLTLEYCQFVEFVPPLGRLESLEVLIIFSWDRLKKVGVEFLGIDGTIETQTSSSPLILFPSLKRLEFNYMPMWEEWEGMTGWSEEEDSHKTITIMPSLSSLQITDCRVLKTLPNFLRNTPLKELVIDEECSPALAQGCRKGRGEWPKISHIPNIEVGFEFVQKDGVYQIDDDEPPRAASTSSSGIKKILKNCLGLGLSLPG